MAARSGLTLHATTVATGGRGLVILGPGGSGKSALALQLMACGAALVADDTTRLEATTEGLLATAAPATRGLIEARGVGILRAPTAPGATVELAVDLGETETERLPPQRTISFLGREVPLILRSNAPHFAAAVWQCLKAGRHA
ncbi:HPr kinase/phosphorylase [Histidinibacterium lentulum]|uniref:Serine kinase n=1 Tax=Histidinibacterium lentulum TaxID=2480588 RepID=A0A3N2R5C0_9RHOB|nr:HPr kinase/phosphatase C-terminal domain-containing protein [Histidinibacterium lentulum]ROU02690.1 serine kinase [Histidinibacterium lentulum]